MAKNRDANAQQVVDGLKAEGVTVTVGLVYNVKAYDAKKKATKKTARAMAKAAAPAAKAVAASTNGLSAGGTKAEAIRDVAKGMEKPFRPRDVRDVLATQGIDASTTQIGQVLRSMGMKRKRRRKATAGGGTPAAGANSAGLNINDLVAAKKLVGQVGSIEKVREALAALARLS